MEKDKRLWGRLKSIRQEIKALESGPRSTNYLIEWILQ
jgi:hypothetical protein